MSSLPLLILYRRVQLVEVRHFRDVALDACDVLADLADSGF